MKQLHEIQLHILKKLAFATSLRYSDLKPNKDLENNKFDFHLDKVIEFGFVEKNENSGYQLTNMGKEYAGRLDEGILPRQAKVGVCVCPVRIDKNGSREYLIYTRLKQPFYGGQGFLSGKVRFGDKIYDTAVREMLEETGLTGDPVLYEINHYRVYKHDNNELLEDKILYYHFVENPVGEIIPCDEGTFEWIKEIDFKEKVTNHFVSFNEFLSHIKWIKEYDGIVRFKEVDQKTDKF